MSVADLKDSVPSSDELSSQNDKNIDVFGDLVQLFNQIFLKSNLENDSEIKSIITPNMGISFSSIVELPRVAAVSTDNNLIRNALKSTNNITFADDIIHISYKTEQHTLILRDIPSTTSSDDILHIFQDSIFPAVKSVRSDMNNTWFVIFNSEEDARTALLHLKNCKFEGNPIRARLKTESASRSLFSDSTAAPTGGFRQSMLSVNAQQNGSATNDFYLPSSPINSQSPPISPLLNMHQPMYFPYPLPQNGGAYGLPPSPIHAMGHPMYPMQMGGIPPGMWNPMAPYGMVPVGYPPHGGRGRGTNAARNQTNRNAKGNYSTFNMPLNAPQNMHNNQNTVGVTSTNAVDESLPHDQGNNSTAEGGSDSNVQTQLNRNINSRGGNTNGPRARKDNLNNVRFDERKGGTASNDNKKKKNISDSKDKTKHKNGKTGNVSAKGNAGSSKPLEFNMESDFPALDSNATQTSNTADAAVAKTGNGSWADAVMRRSNDDISKTYQVPNEDHSPSRLATEESQNVVHVNIVAPDHSLSQNISLSPTLRDHADFYNHLVGDESGTREEVVAATNEISFGSFASNSEVHQGEKPRENLAQTFVDKNKIIAETNATSSDSSISVITSSEPLTEIDRKAEVNSTANNKSGKLSFVEALRKGKS